MRQRSSPENRSEVSVDSALSRRLPCSTDVPVPEGVEERVLRLGQEAHEHEGGTTVACSDASVNTTRKRAMPRMHEVLDRIARLMARNGLYGIPQRRQWRRKRSGTRPAYVRNHLERLHRTEPNTKWVTDITYIHTAGGWLYLCVVVDLYGGKVVGWSMSTTQDRQLILRAVLMACWQRPNRQPVILHSDRGTQFTSYEYQQFLKDHHITLSMSDVGHCGDNAPAEGFFGMLKRERVNRRRYLTVADARSDVFDYIERFHNPRIQRRLDSLDRELSTLTQPSVKTG